MLARGLWCKVLQSNSAFFPGYSWFRKGCSLCREHRRNHYNCECVPLLGLHVALELAQIVQPESLERCRFGCRWRDECPTPTFHECLRPNRKEILRKGFHGPTETSCCRREPYPRYGRNSVPRKRRLFQNSLRYLHWHSGGCH